MKPITLDRHFPLVMIFFHIIYLLTFFILFVSCGDENSNLKLKEEKNAMFPPSPSSLSLATNNPSCNPNPIIRVSGILEGARVILYEDPYCQKAISSPSGEAKKQEALITSYTLEHNSDITVDYWAAQEILVPTVINKNFEENGDSSNDQTITIKKSSLCTSEYISYNFEPSDDCPEAIYNFYFPYRRNSRLWFDVESTEGFFKGNALLLCWSEVFPSCSSDPNGRATIYHVDAHRRRIYVLTDPTGLDLDYRQGMYVWRAEGYAKTPLLKEPMRLYNTTDSMAIQGELTNEFNENITTLNLGTGSLPFFYTSSLPLPRGITLSTQNALIQTPTTPFILQEQIDGEYRVKATDPNDNTHLAARTFRISIVDPPTSFSYSLPNPVSLNVGEDRLDNQVIVYPVLQEGASELYFELDSSSDPLPEGISFNERSGLIDGIPTSYTPQSNLTVLLYHPISSLAAVLSTNVNIITVPQN